MRAADRPRHATLAGSMPDLLSRRALDQTTLNKNHNVNNPFYLLCKEKLTKSKLAVIIEITGAGALSLQETFNIDEQNIKNHAKIMRNCFTCRSCM